MSGDGTSGPGWFADPAGRHEVRWWDGTAWTEVAADGGVEVPDPAGAALANGAGAALHQGYAPPHGPQYQAGPHGSQPATAGPGAGSDGPTRAVFVLALVVLAGVGLVVGRALAGDESAGGDPVGRDEVVGIIEDGFYENFRGAVSQEEAACGAEEVVDRIGHRQLLELGIGPENPYDAFSVVELSEEGQRDAVAGLVECVSDGRLPGYMASQYSSGGEMTFEQGTCVADAQVAALGPTRMRELLVDGNMNPTESIASLGEGDEVAQLEAIDTECLGDTGDGASADGAPADAAGGPSAGAAATTTTAPG